MGRPPMMALDGSGKLWTLTFSPRDLGWSSKAHYKMNQIPFDIIWCVQSKHVFLYEWMMSIAIHCHFYVLWFTEAVWSMVFSLERPVDMVPKESWQLRHPRASLDTWIRYKQPLLVWPVSSPLDDEFPLFVANSMPLWPMARYGWL